MTTGRPLMRLVPPKRWETIDFGELWAYRELVFFLVWRDVKVRYKRAFFGFAWAIVQPLVTMVIFTVVFGRLAGLPSEGVPYALFTLSALLPWQLFSGAVSGASISLVGNSALLSKVYFPRLIAPLSSVVATLVDFSVALLLLAALMAWYRYVPGPAIVFMPVFVLMALVTALGIGLWTSALTVKYRDVQYLLPFALQATMFASPIAYSSEIVPNGPLRIAFAINPLVGIIQGFRWSLLGTEPPGSTIVVSIVASLLLLLSGLVMFRRMEGTFADVV